MSPAVPNELRKLRKLEKLVRHTFRAVDGGAALAKAQMHPGSCSNLFLGNRAVWNISKTLAELEEINRAAGRPLKFTSAPTIKHGRIKLPGQKGGG